MDERRRQENLAYIRVQAERAYVAQRILDTAIETAYREGCRLVEVEEAEVAGRHDAVMKLQANG